MGALKNNTELHFHLFFPRFERRLDIYYCVNFVSNANCTRFLLLEIEINIAFLYRHYIEM